MHDERQGQGEDIVRRARGVAAGLADVGLTQAEDLLRRLSPEGRAQARRERDARAGGGAAAESPAVRGITR